MLFNLEHIFNGGLIFEKHKGKDSGKSSVWMGFKSKVYDLTKLGQVLENSLLSDNMGYSLDKHFMGIILILGGFDLGSLKELFLIDFANGEANGISEERLAAAELCH